ncbi:hypothetical protein [Saccharothrix australiensis]|uniref:hypothetical protein n=1 Tax=Saccharothrix australiensis TaxID=2072 RepID=UPI001FEC2B70|nr:hypothetical protein [Saccharothrix australiensis]
MDDRHALGGHRAEPAQGPAQFFKWLMVDEENTDRSPMERVKQPKPTKKLIPIIRDDDTKKVLAPAKQGLRPAARRGDHPPLLQHPARGCPKSAT